MSVGRKGERRRCSPVVCVLVRPVIGRADGRRTGRDGPPRHHLPLPTPSLLDLSTPSENLQSPTAPPPPSGSTYFSLQRSCPFLPLLDDLSALPALLRFAVDSHPVLSDTALARISFGAVLSSRNLIGGSVQFRENQRKMSRSISNNNTTTSLARIQQQTIAQAIDES